MGTLGGKVGFGAGIFLALFLAAPVVHLIPGSCFFEGGCGAGEQTDLIVAAFIVLALAVAGGAIVRVVINYLLHRNSLGRDKQRK
jgi:hypothetical protein